MSAVDFRLREQHYTCKHFKLLAVFQDVGVTQQFVWNTSLIQKYSDCEINKTITIKLEKSCFNIMSDSTE